MPKSEASSPIAKAAQAEKTRERLRALIDGRLGTGADRSDLVRMAVQLIVEEVLEAEARDKPSEGPKSAGDSAKITAQ